MLESKRLKHFLTVYELGSIGQAAEKLLLTQPALSKSIRLLEDSLGVRLFDRTTLGVVPTVFGKALALHAKAIEAQVRHAEAQIANLRGLAAGQVSVGVGPSIATTLMPLATERLRGRQLDVELVVTEGLVDDLVPALRRGEIDIAVGSWPRTPEPAFTSEVIATDQICVFAHKDHPLVGQRVGRAQLVEHSWVQPPASQRWRQLFDEQFFESGLPAPKPAVVTNSATYLKALLREQGYLSFVPGLLVPEDCFCPIETDLPQFPVEVSLTYKNRTMLNAACQEVAQALREAAAELGAAGSVEALTRAA